MAKTPEQYAAEAYQSFCEGSWDDSSLDKAYNRYESERQEILIGDPVDELMYVAILFGIEWLIGEQADERFDRAMQRLKVLVETIEEDANGYISL